MQTIRSLASLHIVLDEKFEQICASGQYAEGQFTQQAEALLTTGLRCPTVVMSSCGSALFTMFRWYASHGHRSVVMQNNTFYATGAMALEAGLIPILCDSSPVDPSMGVNSLREVCARTSSVKLVCLTHVGGWVAKDYDSIAQYCRERHLILVEDCAHVFGVPPAGVFGQASCWSFYSTKAVPIGDGGALSTWDQPMMDFALQFRNYGKFVEGGVIRYGKGFNLRMSEWNAAVLCTQLMRVEEILQKRAQDAEALQSIAPCLMRGPTNWYKYPVAMTHVRGFKRAGAVYTKTDQLDHALLGEVQTPVPLLHSHRWADSHVCLPMGEGVYEGQTTSEIRERLRS